MEIENRLCELLVPVFALQSADQIDPEASIVNDLGADSIDFVEIMYLIEKEFGVVLKTSEIISGGASGDDIFDEGRLTSKGLQMLQQHLTNNPGRFRESMTKIDIFQALTVKDLAELILKKKNG